MKTITKYALMLAAVSTIATTNVFAALSSDDQQLQDAVEAGDMQRALDAINKGAYPNAQASEEVSRNFPGVGSPTALHKAVAASDFEMVKMLLAAGAKPDIKAVVGISEGFSPRQAKTALEMAKAFAPSGLVLLKKGSSPVKQIDFDDRIVDLLRNPDKYIVGSRK